MRKVVLPVAGLGTRFLPVTKAVPKEMLPLVDRPCLAYVVAEAIEAGISEFVFITARGKEAIEDYFDRSPALEASLEAVGKGAIAEELRAIARSAQVISVRQHEPRGLGHAILCAHPAVGSEDFAVILPDDVIDHRCVGAPPVLAQLLEAHAASGGVGSGSAVVALKEVPRAWTGRYGICAGPWLTDPGQPGARMRVDRMVEKPAPEVAPSTSSIVGRYILPGEIFGMLSQTKPGRGGELQLTDAIARLCGNAEGERAGDASAGDASAGDASAGDASRVIGVSFVGRHFDTGNPMGLLEASIHYALQRPEYAAQAKDILSRY